ncbi:MaoC family dehydratase N-terminal domain-containing protein [Rhodococcus sp. BP-252]|uniref:MaoC/PaaZ C-terminal domain-containing protein n=1 Tax=unclassified Rhodococcus (in: high G+C Gram-positive bacteria) TaxID=192944 RepID=UPI00143166BB|nr:MULTISPECIES: MaoC/PaaZ C-terminal domain-containing protein [unclassified Rhodococcus (in: high G+C Gram-positive bacteria)]MBY6410841.1 MaoC family dehydratase N-terminal domain-containing protein [Rhodococcus sp. BP-320]MBY6415334.1 MaoC family dehydratase N-terminal domain-containing protein [Rhodococcus sp. BP-321]MBY6419949.1 MaoC family dehydratase N-terminal domain-containing protein [Rhodococcus sp. BP-324]MBY6425397.1 MaoC family dehydratase N-terminal domain-containing protein [Rh
MALDLGVVGVPSNPVQRTWSSKDALLYAVGVGAGQDSSLDELSFVTENSADVAQQVLPTFAVLATQARSGRSLGTFDPAMLVHAEQAFETTGLLPVDGDVQVRSTVTSMQDRGSGALVVTEATAVDSATGELVASSRSSVFIRGESVGSTGDRTGDAPMPNTAPDSKLTYATRPEQALLYRLSGDRNPLHSDPSFAARAGFRSPILHGLCTYGVTGRVLLHELCGSDPTRLQSMSGRFTKPVFPGQELTVSIWDTTDGIRFRVTTSDDTVVLDRGTVTVR